MGLKKIKRISALPMLFWSARALLLCGLSLLFACGGGGGSSKLAPTSSKPVPFSSAANLSSLAASSMPANSSTTNSSLSDAVTISGKITYDFVPHNDNQLGLNYSAVTTKAARGVAIELLDAIDIVIATTTTDNLGNYALAVEKNKMVKVRVKAQLIGAQAPSWNFKVTDNTNGNGIYAMDGSLVAATDVTSIRDLHAPSGWTGSEYTQPRVAAPFAILDSVLIGVERVIAAGNGVNFPPLELRWSTINKAADGELAMGEIGTSFYSGSSIYILGDEDNDTDEYDRHVILHEWGHYLESKFSRSDSIGGDHMYGDKLDMRVAMSEGFANAFSAMMLDDPYYRDASGVQQTNGFTNDVSRKNHAVRGWYSEASVQSILYNFYTGSDGKTAQDFADIFNVFGSTAYSATAAMTSIYVFADELRNLIPSQITNFDALMLEQNIEPTAAFGEDESNSGGYMGALPIYKTLSPYNVPINVCSSNRLGAYNKLAVAQFMRFDVNLAGKYQFSVQEASDDSGDSDPDIYLYRHGKLLAYGESTQVDQESFSHVLPVGTYVLELVDDRVKDVENGDEITACFDVRAQQILEP